MEQTSGASVGRFGVKERNFEGETVLEFAKKNGNVSREYQYLLPKEKKKRVRLKSGSSNSQPDCILCRQCNLKEIGGCKAVTGECSQTVLDLSM